MSIERFDALITPGNQLNPDSSLSERGIARITTTIDAWRDETAPYMVLSGKHSFTATDPPPISEAAAMRNYALEAGIDPEVIRLEEESLETIGNALFTKTEVVEPNEWERLVVITSESHLPRTLKIFEHVYGRDYSIEGVPAPEQESRSQRVYESLGATAMQAVLRGTKPGDSEAIRERLFDAVPGYAGATKAEFAMHSLRGLIKRY